jgi:hypothetical protein
MPFLLNYDIFGNFSLILHQIQLHGFRYLQQQGPTAIANFATTEGFTTILQTIFYSTVIVKGAGGWVNEKDPQKNPTAVPGQFRAARGLKPWLTAPILVADAMLLAYATSSHHVLLHMGPMALNDGHVMFMGMIGVGWATYRPAVLNFFGLKPYLASKKLYDQSLAYLKSRGIDPSTLFKRKT